MNIKTSIKAGDMKKLLLVFLLTTLTRCLQAMDFDSRADLENNTNLELQDGEGKTPLARNLEDNEIMYSRLTKTKTLLEEGAHLTISVNGQLRPVLGYLGYAAQDIDWKFFFEHIIPACTKKNLPYPDAWFGANETSLLHLAAIHNPKKEVFNFLLECGADLEARDSKGNTPLCLAAEHRQDEALNLLIERGANPNVQNSQGQTPLHLAAQIAPSDYSSYVDLDSDPILLYNPYKKNRCISSLVNADIKIDTQDANGDTALNLAINDANYGAIHVLLDKEASVKIANNQGQTPLHCALTTTISPEINCHGIYIPHSRDLF